jgi:glutathione S-transferase
VPVARWLSGQSQLPFLKVDGRIVTGSDQILEEIERLRPEPPLFPADPQLRRRALAIQQHFDEKVAPDLRRLFWAIYLLHPATCACMATDGASSLTCAAWRALFPLMRPLFVRNMGLRAEQVLAAGERMRTHFDRLESEIEASGYLVGDRFGVADLAAAAVMTAIVRPPEFPYPLPEPWPPELVELRANVAEHPAFHWVLGIYARHRGTSSEIQATTTS